MHVLKCLPLYHYTVEESGSIKGHKDRIKLHRCLLNALQTQDHLDGGVAGLSGDTAVVVLAAGHPDVTGLTPGGAPGVLDDPVLLVGPIAAVTDGQDTVVEGFGGALRLVVDT